MTYTTPDLSKSALITIDTQCDFSLPGAVVEIPGTMDVIDNMKLLLRAYRKYRRPIFHIVRLYKKDGSNADLCRRKMIEEGASIVMPGSAGAELVPELKPDPHVQLDAALLLKGKIQTWSEGEFVLYKPRWGAFYQTPLEKELRRLGINTLVVCGCNFPNCPRTTIYEADERDFRVIMVDDAVSGIYERGRQELRNIGVSLWPAGEVEKKLKVCRL